MTISSGLQKILLLTTVGLLFAACTAINPPKPSLPSRAGIVPGEQITVKGSQNIYGVARKYNVSMRDLIVLNDIQPPFTVKQGQKLTLPAGTAGDGVPSSDINSMPAPTPSSVPSVQSESLAPIQAVELPPVERAPAPMAKPMHGLASAPPADVLTTPSPVKSVSTTASMSSAQQIASMTALTRPSDDSSPTSFVWPVQGPVLSGYGPKGEGLNNDGVNIGAPKGAPVVAAANGIVVYAGNDMKGFGNLILIRHQGSYVTAYAHLDRTLVNKDAVVAQGDMIGTVGKSGNVAAPQLHFEMRHQGKAIDPTGVITKDRG